MRFRGVVLWRVRGVYVSNRRCLRARLVGANARLPGDYVHAIFVQHDDRYLNRLCYDKGVQQRQIVWEGEEVKV